MDRLRGRTRNGFTLIEVLVVLVIFGIALGLVAVRLLPDDARLARQEGERTALLLERAADEAENTGQPMAWLPLSSEASFQIPDGQGGWKTLDGDEFFATRTLPGALRWSALRFGTGQEGSDPNGSAESAAQQAAVQADQRAAAAGTSAGTGAGVSSMPGAVARYGDPSADARSKPPLRVVFLPGEAAESFAISLGTANAHVILRGDTQGRVSVENPP